MADANPYLDPKFAPDPPKGGAAPRTPPGGIGQARRGGFSTPEGVKQGVRNVQDWVEWATQNPLARGVGSVLGTTERAGSSGVSWALDKLQGKKPTTNPVAGVMDPEGDIGVTHRLEHQELDPLKKYRQPGNSLMVNPLSWIPTATQNAGWKQALLDFATQSAHDPATYAPGADIISLGSRAARMAGAGRAARAGARAVGRHIPEAVKHQAGRANEMIRSYLTTSHEPLKGATQSGLNIIRSREGGARHFQAKREAEYAPVADRQATLRDLGDTLHAHGLRGHDITSRNVTPRNALGLQNPVGLNNVLQGVPQSFPRGSSEAAKALRGTRPAVPEPLIPLHQRLALHKENKLTDAALWREGSPQARAQMRARGYVPSAADAALPNANLVQGDYGRRYIPEQSIQDQAVAEEANAARGFSTSRGGVKRSKFDAPKHGGPQNLGPLDERFANRLQSSAYLEPKRRAEQNIIRDLGLTPTQVGRTDARITDLKERLALTPKKPGALVAPWGSHAQITKHIEKYKALHERQTAAAYKDALLREKHLNPGASVGDQKLEGLREQLRQTPVDHPDREAIEKAVAAHENPLSGVLRGKKTAERIAARDVAWHGGDASAAFNEEGKALGHVSTGASGEKARQRRVAATGAQTRADATKSALHDLDTRLSSMGLKQQKRVTKKLTDLRTKQAIRERTNLASLEKHATPKVKPEPAAPAVETPNLFRHQSTQGKPEVNTQRGGTYFSMGAPDAAYSEGRGFGQGLGGKHLVKRVATPKNPLNIGLPQDLKDKPFESMTYDERVQHILHTKTRPLSSTVPSIGAAKALRPGKPTAGNLSAAWGKEGGDEKNLRRYLKALGVKGAEIERIFKGPEGRWAANDRIASELAKQHGHDAIIHQSESDAVEHPQEFFALHSSAHRAPESPNIFGLPWLSNRKLTHELPKSSPIMKRIATLRDERASRGGAEFAPLLHALPTDTTKATGKVHRLAGRAERDLALKQKADATAAAAHRERLARNAAVSKIEKGVGEDPLYQGKIEMPSPLHDRLFGPKVYEPPGLGEHVANIQKQIMFANILPHGGGNVGGQQILAGGGLGTAAHGVEEAVKIARKDPEALARLDFTKKHGAIHEHGYEKFVPGENIAAKAYRAIQRPLTVSGEGQASALMHKYLKEGMTPADAAEEVRKTFGHPNESTKFSKAGKRFGAPFMKWITETVPTAAKKMATSPHSRNALKQFARADYDVNSDVFEPEYGVEWRPGGFADKAAELAIKPASYFSGPSVTPSMQEEGEQAKHGLWDAAKGYLPYSSLLEMGKQPLTPMQRARGGFNDLPPWAKGMQPFGSSFKRAETPLHILQRELKREGLTRPTP